ncbi:MAG TPA: BrnT family toxin [Kofleriaceae bacterium]|nr:BrnT family toxin [Kofleriaceae bacterium]
MAVRFEWDPTKAQENSRKHDVTFEEASECFADEHALDLEDPMHPERLILIGLSGSARLLFTVYAVREHGDIIRIISARKATRHERSTYEEGSF